MRLYTIRKYHLGKLEEEQTRKRRDAAAYLLCRMTYAAIKASAKLDTEAGHHANQVAHLAYESGRATVSVSIGDYQLTFC